MALTRPVQAYIHLARVELDAQIDGRGIQSTEVPVGVAGKIGQQRVRLDPKMSTHFNTKYL